MKRAIRVISLVVLAGLQPIFPGPARGEETTAQLQAAFQEYSGARLVFQARDLPTGSYYDIMPALGQARRLRAARIALQEVRKLPRRYLEQVHLKAVGIFAACASRHDDGFHPYDEKLEGYRYFGIYNGTNAIGAAYYTDEQLPLTLHHEIFHHVDATRDGEPGHTGVFSHDERFRKAISGEKPYAALHLAPETRAALEKLSTGVVLERSVSRYAEKSVGEDKAETARHFMTALPDALLQMADRPQLPGSQRLLHVLHSYQQAVADGPDTRWFIQVALGRPPADDAGPTRLLERLEALDSSRDRPDDPEQALAQARTLLEQAAALKPAALPPPERRRLVTRAADLTHQLLCWRIQPRQADQAFTVWGSEDRHGINWTLRRDLADFAADAQRLKKIASLSAQSADVLLRAQLKSLRLISRYQRFIGSHWEMSRGTRQVFEQTGSALIDALPEQHAALAHALRRIDLDRLAEAIAADGHIDLRSPVRPALPDNPYLKKVDAAVSDPAVRAAIRRVQPACVRLGGGSGVNLTPQGHILTAGHVAERVGVSLPVTFPNGKKYRGVCTAYDRHLDLAIVKLDTSDELPSAPLARQAPQKGDAVVCIGQPGSTTPEGDATGYQPFHVSTGIIRGFLDDPLGNQALGRTKHDAWTYWGHSGSPLFNERGQIVALHNSWDATTAMRHAVTHQAIVHFLKRHKVPYTTGD